MNNHIIFFLSLSQRILGSTRHIRYARCFQRIQQPLHHKPLSSLKTGPLGKHCTNREQEGSMFMCLSLSFFSSRSFDHQHQGAVQVFVFPGLDALETYILFYYLAAGLH